jgi:head-tail adaptor
MAILGPRVATAARPHRVTLQNPGPGAPDGDGGFLQSWTDLAPASMYVSIQPATARELERVTAGTALSTASHIVTGPYHPQVTTQTRILFSGRTLFVIGVANPEERNVETVMVCNEVVT